MKDIDKKIFVKCVIVDILIFSGITELLKIFWDELEILFDGGIQESISDTVIATILITLLWLRIRKWLYMRKEE
jgi:hypothetical protein